jgi:hypothetical protein
VKERVVGGRNPGDERRHVGSVPLR